MNEQKELVAHLMRRAGFGATKQEIESLASLKYEKIVDSLVSPSDTDSLPEDLIRRYHVDQNEMRLINSAVGKWVYKMVTTKAPLIEKMSLFWHGLFATGYSKVFHGQTMYDQIKMFRNHGMGTFSGLLLQLSKDPAMLYWLDNHDNHASEINENYGRELLELFSMSIGNYTEDDVKECSRSFTGWTIQNAEYMGLRAQSASIWPYSQIAWQHEYVSSDHDNGTKTFLGKTGNFNGEDIIEIICKHSATAEFISRLNWMDLEGEIHENARHEFDFGYRFSELDARQGRILVSAIFELKLTDAHSVRQKALECQRFRIEKQPYNQPSCGSVFKNPLGDHAARLIEASGLKGTVRGSAQISPKHSNFIVNLGGTRADDILWLMDLVQERVLKDHGRELIPEVQILQ